VGTAAAARQAERLNAESRARRSDPAGVSVHRVGRSPARATMLILGGVLVVVVAIVLVLSLHGGGKSSGQGSTNAGGARASTGSTTATKAHKRTSTHQGESSVVGNPASMAVVVLNGTSTNGLAHGLAKDLQQGGYSKAEAMTGTPPGSHATTVVEYTSGHRADAQAVASSLSVTQVQPIEAAISSLASAATVVVLAGEDKAAAAGETSGAAGASSENNSEAAGAGSAAG
jgi:hypothetical protein